jgi:arylsulfatase A-like enzyme
LSRIKIKQLFQFFSLLLPLVCHGQLFAAKRPNIVIFLADDMGYADAGSFGGEIATPNIDALAGEGVRFTQFYTHASCSPTRSMLLSGVDTHLNGLGNMSECIAPTQKG